MATPQGGDGKRDGEVHLFTFFLGCVLASFTVTKSLLRVGKGKNDAEPLGPPRAQVLHAAPPVPQGQFPLLVLAHSTRGHRGAQVKVLYLVSGHAQSNAVCPRVPGWPGKVQEGALGQVHVHVLWVWIGGVQG